jgi:hypothetical protein
MRMKTFLATCLIAGFATASIAQTIDLPGLIILKQKLLDDMSTLADDIASLQAWINDANGGAPPPPPPPGGGAPGITVVEIAKCPTLDPVAAAAGFSTVVFCDTFWNPAFIQKDRTSPFPTSGINWYLGWAGAPQWSMANGVLTISNDPSGTGNGFQTSQLQDTPTVIVGTRFPAGDIYTEFAISFNPLAPSVLQSNHWPSVWMTDAQSMDQQVLQKNTGTCPPFAWVENDNLEAITVGPNPLPGQMPTHYMFNFNAWEYNTARGPCAVSKTGSVWGSGLANNAIADMDVSQLLPGFDATQFNRYAEVLHFNVDGSGSVQHFMSNGLTGPLVHLPSVDFVWTAGTIWAALAQSQPFLLLGAGNGFPMSIKYIYVARR